MNTELIGNGLIYLAGILWFVEMIPQITKTVKTKDVSSISLAYFIICFLAYLIYCIGNVLLANTAIVLAHIPSMFLTLIMLILIFKYREKK